MEIKKRRNLVSFNDFKMKNLILIFLVIFLATIASAKEYHVSVNGRDHNNGSFVHPFQTISAAAKIALPGDTVTVHQGTYREMVTPANGGRNDLSRILYRAAPSEEVVIKGSEVIKGWEKVAGGVWKVTLPDSFFGNYNPYKDPIFGDWFNDNGRVHHTGEVYLNEKSLYEVTSLEMVKKPAPVTKARDKEGSLYQWYCESENGTTTIWANFHQVDPTKELVEINVRKSCFYPEITGRDYITVRGFHMSQAATQWAPPTAEQIGLIGTNWSKGWIIEDNTISNSKCAGITLGKDRASGQNVKLGKPAKNGTTVYNEVIFNALRNGWSKEKIGSHIVRGNTIFNCEQGGIVGSLGAVFSTISNNHIYNIWTKRMFSGAEIAGIKIHAAIDVLISNNRINNAGRGIWIDWMAQGARITGNLLYDNTSDDLYSEVNHGPYLVDNNILLSEISIREHSEGGAFAHNLIGGKIRIEKMPLFERVEAYFLPHSTQMAGIKSVYGGDNRFFNNLFIKAAHETDNTQKGTDDFWGLNGYDNIQFPILADGNVYYNGAKQGKTDLNCTVQPDFDPGINIEEEGGRMYLHIKLDENIKGMDTQMVTTELLGETIISEAIFESPDGSPIKLDRDYFGKKRNVENPSPGPFEIESSGKQRFEVW